MNFDFDTLSQRQDTYSYKWEKYTKDVLPMWVADMDFPTAPVIQKAVIDYAEKGLYGYSTVTSDISEILVTHLAQKHSWQVKTEEMVFMPGLVPIFYHLVRLFEDKNAGIVINNPVYHHFILAANEKTRIDIPFVRDNNTWVFDLDLLEKHFKNGAKAFMLCNPHNPNGKVFTQTELLAIAELCCKYQVLLMVDEIHCDLILSSQAKHTSVGAVHTDIRKYLITVLAPSKTYNLAGLGFSFAVIQNKDLRQKIQRSLLGISPMLSGFAIVAAKAAYTEAESWRKSLISYLRNNHETVFEAINAIEGFEMFKLEATYLAWIKYDNIKWPDLIHRLEKHGLGVQDGVGFGLDGYFRLNFATQHQRVVQGLDCINNTVLSYAKS